jgi:hypothetical protein
MRVTKKILNHLENWFNPFYTIKGVEEVKKIVKHEIPFVTGVLHYKFPEYLKGFEKYYERKNGRGYFRLKEKYQENRPQYEILISYKIYDIELTEVGKAVVESRNRQHERLAKMYSDLLK